MGVEVVSSDMAQVSVDKAADVDKSFRHEKENGKLNVDVVHETIQFGSHGEESDKREGNNASDAHVPKDAVEEWPAPKQIHYFYFVRYRPYDDPKLKAKMDQADKEIQKWNKARYQLTDELKAQRTTRGEFLSQLKALNVDFEQFKSILDEKKKEMEPLQEALGKLRNNNSPGGRSGICSSEEELNDIIYSLKYRIQHESIPLSEEKQLLREIKQLEGTRERVIANAAMRAKIQDSLGQKEAIQDQVKLMGVDLDGVKKEKQAIWSKKNSIKEKVEAIESKIESLQKELTFVTEKRDKAYDILQELRKQRDDGNGNFYQSRKVLTKAKELAAKKDIKDLEELSIAEVEKFMTLWCCKKAFRDDYEKRILSSLDSRQLSRDGRIRNPDEKQLVAPVLTSETETFLKPIIKQPKEESKPSSQLDNKVTKKVQKDAEIKGELNPSLENVVVEKEVSGSGKLQDISVLEEVDPVKLKEMKREEEIAKAKQAMERKKRLADKAAVKAAIRAQKEAEKKLKEREKKAKKKAAASAVGSNPEEPTEATTEASELETVDVYADVPAPAAVLVKERVQKGKTVRYRNRSLASESISKPVLRRKKSTNYWVWGKYAAAIVAVFFLLALVYYFLV